MSKVHAKLMQARIKLQNTKLSKSGLNKFAGYQYFELSDFLPAVQTIFSEIGLCGVISFATDLATLTITDVEDGSNIVLTSPMADAPLKGCLPIQCMGAIETYTRRYLWVSAMEIVEHDQVDAVIHDSPKHSPTKSAVKEVSDDEIPYLQELAVEIIASCKQGKPNEAVQAAKESNLTNEQKTYLWTLLDSATRSAFKVAEKNPQL